VTSKVSYEDLGETLNTVKSDIEHFVAELKTDTLTRARDMENDFMYKYDNSLANLSEDLRGLS
jgi:hypothetical protein